MQQEMIEQLRASLQTDHLESFLLMLLENEALTSEIKERATLLFGRLENLESQEVKGVIAKEDAILERNKIRAAMIALLGDVQASMNTKGISKKKLPGWIIPAAIYTVIVSMILWWFFLPRKTFRIQADLLVESVTFRYVKGPTSFARGEMKSCIWQNFETLQIDGERLFLDEALDGVYEEQFVLPSKLKLKADPAIAGVGVRMGEIQLEKLKVASGALITMGLPETDGRVFRMTIQQQENLRADLTYQDSLILETEQVKVEGLAAHTEFFYPVQLKFMPPQGLAREFSIKSYPGGSTVDFEPSQPMMIESEQLLITELSFLKPVETVAVPTILKGTVEIAEVDQGTFQHIELQEGDGLHIIAVDNLYLDELRLEEGSIALKISGLVKHLTTGAGNDERSPNNMQWMWQNRRPLLIGLGIALIGLATFLPEKIRKQVFTVLKIVKGF